MMKYLCINHIDQSCCFFNLTSETKDGPRAERDKCESVLIQYSEKISDTARTENATMWNIFSHCIYYGQVDTYIL